MVASVISRYSFGSPCTVHPHMWYDDMRMFAGSRDLRDRYVLVVPFYPRGLGVSPAIYIYSNNNLYLQKKC